ncbi:UvrD-helicase domain-containing protein [Lapidilactobacillus achengensis]|uniref:UvrD-helicase domain-containing protein n=1 Tax=Lapidilactobacillus achengensis TaxID=2486000 RepID=A0ABW1UMM1_9LACO
MVMGPGTGKTQILSRRVAHLLLQAKVEPQQIVCLIYIEAPVCVVRILFSWNSIEFVFLAFAR